MLQFDSSHIQTVLSRFSGTSLSALNEADLMKRLDTKYVGSVERVEPLLTSLLESHTCLEIDGRRDFHYENIYFDTPNRDFYHDHVRGKLPRHKIRKRMYHNAGEIYLEVKSKSNTGRTSKRRIESPSFEPVLSESDRSFLQEFCHLPHQNVHETLRTSYDRITLLDQSKTIRVTIDTSLVFAYGTERLSASNLVIVEVKSSGRESAEMRNVLTEHKIYQSGFSKYCTGMAMLAPEVKTNRLRPTIHHIQKLTPLERSI